MDKPWTAHGQDKIQRPRKRAAEMERTTVERTTGFEPTTLTLARRVSSTLKISRVPNGQEA